MWRRGEEAEVKGRNRGVSWKWGKECWNTAIVDNVQLCGPSAASQ